MADLDYLIVPHLNRKTLTRLFSKIAVNRDTGCWEWTACLSPAGYGKTNIGSTLMVTHRLIYAWLVEPIPNGRGRHVPCLDHLCMNRRCCNPAHLELVTPKENLMRGGGICAQNARKTHCKRGHLLPVRDGRGRTCQECVRDQHHRRYMANREAIITKTTENGRRRMNGPRREELLRQKRENYHATKVLKHGPHKRRRA